MTEPTKHTREVATELDVNLKTLQSWVRDGLIAPPTTGEGRMLRIEWRPEDVESAKRLRDRNGQTPLQAAFGPELFSALRQARRQREFEAEGEVSVCSAQRGRVFRSDTTLAEVLRRVPGRVLIILR